jgi:hypothetical protein
MAQTAMRQQGQTQQRRPGNFLADTRQALITMSPMVPSTADTAGIVTTQQLPTSGYLSAIWFILSATGTTASGASNVVKPYPQTPYGLIRQIRVYNNMGVDLWRTSGYGAYQYMKTLRTATDPTQAPNSLSYATTDSGNNSVFSRYFNKATSLATSSSETVRAGFYLPIAWGTMGQAGLQLLQDDAVKYFLEITWGDHTDLYSTFGAGATLTTETLTPVVETFATPRDPNNRPDLSYSKIVIEEQQAFDTGSGANTYKFVTGNMITRLIQWFENGTTVKPLDPTEFSLMNMNYAQTQVPYNINPDVELFRQRFLYGLDMTQGTYVWELAAALGLPEFPTLRDVINTIKLTNLQTVFTLTGVTPSSSAFKTVKEMLSPNRRF